MGKIMGQINKKRTSLMLLDKLNGFFSISFGNGILIGGSFYDFGVPHQRHVEVFNFRISKCLFLIHVVYPVHVLAVRYSKIIIKTVIGGQIGRKVSQMPFTYGSRMIILVF